MKVKVVEKVVVEGTKEAEKEEEKVAAKAATIREVRRKQPPVQSINLAVT